MWCGRYRTAADGVRHPPAVSLVAGFERSTEGANTTQNSPVLPENLNLLKCLTLTPRAIILEHVRFGPCYSIVMRSR
jgi:hypothetical protein